MVTDEDVKSLIEVLRFKTTPDSLLCFKDEKVGNTTERKLIEKEYRLMLNYAENVLDAYKTITENSYYPHLWDKFKESIEDKANKKPPFSLQHKDLKIIADDWKDVQDKLGRFLAWAWRQDQDAKEYERMLEAQAEQHERELVMCQ